MAVTSTCWVAVAAPPPGLADGAVDGGADCGVEVVGGADEADAPAVPAERLNILDIRLSNKPIISMSCLDFVETTRCFFAR